MCIIGGNSKIIYKVSQYNQYTYMNVCACKFELQSMWID
jgi:hypothetical protein